MSSQYSLNDANVSVGSDDDGELDDYGSKSSNAFLPTSDNSISCAHRSHHTNGHT